MSKTVSSSYLDAFLDSYHNWTSNGKGLKYASRELRYCLNEQRKRLQKKGIFAEESYEHVQEEIRGSLLKDGDPYTASIVYREGKRILSYRNKEKSLKEYKEPVTFYGCLLDKKGYEDKLCTCPNCGHQTMLSGLNEGCPYCGTVFETEDSYPVFTSFYNVSSITERATLMDRLKKRMIIAAIVVGLLMLVVCFISYDDYQPIFRVIASLFMGCFTGAMAALMTYLFSSILLLIKVFHEAGKALPLLPGLTTRKKLTAKLQSIDPDFSFEYFEGRILSLFRTIAYSDDRDSLSIYTGQQDLSGLDDLIDIQYRGVLQLKDVKITEDMTQVRVKAFLTNTYAKDRIYRRDENYLLTVERENGSRTDPGFDLLKIQCPNCGSTFDALHEKNCPHCGSSYDLVHDDWVIREIRRV